STVCNSGSVAGTMGVLLGDTTGDGSVNSADISQTKARSGQTVGSGNFRSDVTIDGSLNSADISLVKSKSGPPLPPPPYFLFPSSPPPPVPGERVCFWWLFEARHQG